MMQEVGGVQPTSSGVEAEEEFHLRAEQRENVTDAKVLDFALEEVGVPDLYSGLEAA